MKKLLTSVLIVALSFYLVGCSSVFAKEADETAEQAVINILEAIKTANIETLKKYEADKLLGSTDEQNTIRNLKMFENLEYDILDITEKEGIEESGTGKDGTKVQPTELEAVVKLEIRNKDLTSTVQEYIDSSNLLGEENEALGEAKLNEADMVIKNTELFIEIVDKVEDVEYKDTLDVRLSKINGRWKIKLTNSLQNAIYGNMLLAQAKADWGQEVSVATNDNTAEVKEDSKQIKAKSDDRVIQRSIVVLR